jgi:hypothetical protein
MTVTIPVVAERVAPVSPLTPASTPAEPPTSASPVLRLFASSTSAHHVVVHSQLPVNYQGSSGKYAGSGGGGSGGGGGLPAAPSAPAAPASASAGHDGNGGARHPLAVFTSSSTTTQLKLIGTSRDHTADGAGREAALPTTSPD